MAKDVVLDPDVVPELITLFVSQFPDEGLVIHDLKLGWDITNTRFLPVFLSRVGALRCLRSLTIRIHDEEEDLNKLNEISCLVAPTLECLHIYLSQGFGMFSSYDFISGKLYVFLVGCLIKIYIS